MSMAAGSLGVAARRPGLFGLCGWCGLCGFFAGTSTVSIPCPLGGSARESISCSSYQPGRSASGWYAYWRKPIVITPERVTGPSVQAPMADTEMVFSGFFGSWPPQNTVPSASWRWKSCTAVKPLPRPNRGNVRRSGLPSFCSPHRKARRFQESWTSGHRNPYTSPRIIGIRVRVDGHVSDVTERVKEKGRGLALRLAGRAVVRGAAASAGTWVVAFLGGVLRRWHIPRGTPLLPRFTLTTRCDLGLAPSTQGMVRPRPNSPDSSATTGRSRPSTTSATPPSPRTPPSCGPATHPARWPPGATSPSEPSGQPE